MIEMCGCDVCNGNLPSESHLEDKCEQCYDFILDCKCDRCFYCVQLLEDCLCMCWSCFGRAGECDCED